MLQFGRLLSFPLKFKNLEPKIRQLKVTSFNAREEDGIISVNSVINGHDVQLVIQSKIIDSSSPVMCYCGCEQFKYNHAYSLYKIGSLLNPELFVLKPPKSKNVSLTLSGCKHLILASRILFQNRNLITQTS